MIILFRQRRSHRRSGRRRAGQKPISGITCPEGLVRYVIRTHESVILDDASRPNLFSEDDYLRDRQAKSILCVPLIRQGRLAGLLYLENTLTSHAFTPDRIAVLELLAAQAAISLENTRLYSDLQEREAKVRRLVESNIIGIFIWHWKVASLRPTTRFSTWWDTIARISSPVACAGRI